MIKRVVLVSFCCSLLISTFASAGFVRYKDAVFTQLKIDSVQYTVADGHGLLMDIYQPVGDTVALRPLIILAHGGSFMHGDRKCDRMPTMCAQLANRGYVVASIDYRLARLSQMASKKGALKEMIKAVADGRSSVAWFLKDISSGNAYRIDKNKIFFGGSSAGAILAEHLGFICNAASCNKGLCKVVTNYLPDSAALPTHTIRGILSLAGAVLDTSLISSGCPSVLHVHADDDHIVQYNFKAPFYGFAPFKLAGLGASKPRYISQHVDYTEYVFHHAGHTPWDGDDKAFAILMQQVFDYLYLKSK